VVITLNGYHRGNDFLVRDVINTISEAQQDAAVIVYLDKFSPPV